MTDMSSRLVHRKSATSSIGLVAIFSIVSTIASLVVVIVVSVAEMRLDPIELKASTHGAELARQDEEQAIQRRQLASQGAELAGLRAEVTGFKEELARLRSEQVRQGGEISGLSEEFIVLSGEVKGKMKEFRFAVETLDASRLPPVASPVERLDGGSGSPKGAIWHVPGTIGCASFVASAEFAVPVPAAELCQAAT